MEQNQHQTSIPNTKRKYIPDDNVTYRPLLSYTFYLFVRLFKNKSTWILTIIALAFAIVLAMVPVFSTDNQIKLQLIRIMNFIGAILLIILSMVFGTIKALNIFTDSQSDGTELIIISKPISRLQVIVTRYAFFVFISLLFSLTILIGWAIGLSIVGTDLVPNFGGALGGVFIASLIAQLFTGVISILVALKFSTRAARILPIIIASFSGIISFAPLIVPTISPPDFKVDQYKKIETAINDRIKTPEGSLSVKDGNDSTTEIFKIASISLTGELQFSTPLKIVKVAEKYHLYIDSFSYVIENTEGSRNFRISNLVEGYENWDEAYITIMKTVAEILANESISASGLVAVNFINPVSAFSSIAGVNDDTLISSMFPYQASSLAYNYSYGKFSLGSKLLIDDDDYGSQSQIPLPVALNVGKVTQVDNQVLVTLIWVGIFIIVVGLSVLVYYRKDFK